MRTSLIVAMAEDRVIGRGNALPWHIPEDLAKFKELTLNKPIIMGRKTFESIGKPLPRRTNIVVTRDTTFEYTGVYRARSLEEAVAIAREEMPPHDIADAEIMIIGGEQIFDMALSDHQPDKIYLTEVEMTVPDGDAYFPKLDSSWTVIETSRLVAASRGKPGANFSVLQRAA
jgi:dihydrofolate reductase